VPEGDTVYRAARLLDRGLSGQVLTGTDFRVPQHATADLTGGTVLETVSRGKHLLTRIDRGVDRFTLHTHLKMEGAWRVIGPGRRWPRPAHTARVVLETDTAVAIGFSLGIVELLDRADEHRVVGHLGPDLLGPDWDEDVALARLGADPARPIREALLDQSNLAGAGPKLNTGQPSSRQIAEALLDQRCLAGIGNMWKAETLFLTGVNPFTPVPEVPDLRRVVRMAHRLLDANKERAVQATTGSTRRGEQFYVFERSGQPCRRCGSRVESREQGPPGRERLTYWCPTCQPPA
jgi:endonuclease VIII